MASTDVQSRELGTLLITIDPLQDPGGLRTINRRAEPRKSIDAVVFLMPKTGVLRRRNLKTKVRKRVTAYYSEEEQRLIARAAAIQGVSQSSFVASAALKEARKAVLTKRP